MGRRATGTKPALSAPAPAWGRGGGAGSAGLSPPLRPSTPGSNDWHEGTLIDPRLNHLYQALTHKADTVQHEFGAVGDALQALGRKLVNTPSGETGPLRAEQASLRERQLALAAEINVWRDRARAVLRQRDEAAPQAFMDELAAAGDG